MKLIHEILGNVFSKKLKKNKKFYNLHKGQSCYLFGNGKSLQYYDLKSFNDKPSIGCNALFAHKDINDIALKYYYIGHPLFFYKFWRNPYSKSYEKNKVGAFYKNKIKNNPDIQYFIPLNNCFGIQGENINYVHHFGKKVNWLSIDYEMDKIFTMMTGALAGMLGMALYMGFSDITLVGCDYTLSPNINGHFFTSHPLNRSIQHSVFASETLDFVKAKVTIRTIVPNKTFRGQSLTSITYKEFTNKDPVFVENFKLLSKVDLKDLNLMNMPYKIY